MRCPHSWEESGRRPDPKKDSTICELHVRSAPSLIPSCDPIAVDDAGEVGERGGQKAPPTKVLKGARFCLVTFYCSTLTVHTSARRSDRAGCCLTVVGSSVYCCVVLYRLTCPRAVCVGSPRIPALSDRAACCAMVCCVLSYDALHNAKEATPYTSAMSARATPSGEDAERRNGRSRRTHAEA